MLSFLCMLKNAFRHPRTAHFTPTSPADLHAVTHVVFPDSTTSRLFLLSLESHVEEDRTYTASVLDAGHRTMMIGSIWMTNVTEKIA